MPLCTSYMESSTLLRDEQEQQQQQVRHGATADTMQTKRWWRCPTHPRLMLCSCEASGSSWLATWLPLSLSTTPVMSPAHLSLSSREQASRKWSTPFFVCSLSTSWKERENESDESLFGSCHRNGQLKKPKHADNNRLMGFSSKRCVQVLTKEQPEATHGVTRWGNTFTAVSHSYNINKGKTFAAVCLSSVILLRFIM